jgi:hypothetical protein
MSVVLKERETHGSGAGRWGGNNYRDLIFKSTWNQAWCHIPVIPALRRLRQEVHEFEASLGSTVRPCLKKQNKTKNLHDNAVLNGDL